MKTFQFLFLFIVILSGCTTSYYATQQEQAMNPDIQSYILPGEGRLGNVSNRQPGKCYAKVLIPNEYDKQLEDYIVYTGDLSDKNIDYRTIQLETKPATTAWKKLKADRNCFSADPEDCKVWCLIDVPAEFVELHVLYDTMKTKAFEIRTIEILELARKGGYTAWMEVMCNDRINADFVGKLNDKLSAAGFDLSTDSKSMDRAMKEALTNFQRTNNLPVGQLDMCTLDYLGIRY